MSKNQLSETVKPNIVEKLEEKVEQRTIQKCLIGCVWHCRVGSKTGSGPWNPTEPDRVPRFPLVLLHIVQKIWT